MTNRDKNWDPNISKKLKNKNYRANFFKSLIQEEEMTLREAIHFLAKCMGNKEFARLIGKPESNTTRTVNPNNVIKDETLFYIIEKIGCKIAVEVL